MERMKYQKQHPASMETKSHASHRPRWFSTIPYLAKLSSGDLSFRILRGQYDAGSIRVFCLCMAQIVMTVPSNNQSLA